MSIEGQKEMREADVKSGIIPNYKIKAVRRHNLIFFNPTEFERRKK